MVIFSPGLFELKLIIAPLYKLETNKTELTQLIFIRNKHYVSVENKFLRVSRQSMSLMFNFMLVWKNETVTVPIVLMGVGKLILGLGPKSLKWYSELKMKSCDLIFVIIIVFSVSAIIFIFHNRLLHRFLWM